jgi:hypothetical protein
MVGSVIGGALTDQLGRRKLASASWRAGQR